MMDRPSLRKFDGSKIGIQNCSFCDKIPSRFSSQVPFQSSKVRVDVHFCAKKIFILRGPVRPGGRAGRP